MCTAGKNSWSCAQFILLSEYSYRAVSCRADAIAEGPALRAVISPVCPWQGLPSGLGHAALGLSCAVGGPVLSHAAQTWWLA